MRAQRQGCRILRAEGPDQLGPEQARGAQLGDLHEEVHADAEEEGEPRREGIDGEAPRQGRADILQPIGQGEGQLLNGRRTCLQHVIAGDGNRIELRHLRRRIGDDIGDDPHRRAGRVDVGIADHELLQDVVLDGPGDLLGRHPLLLGGDDEGRQHRQHGAVHGHGDAHLVQRNAREQDLHILDAVDGDPRLADIADHAGMIGIIAAVGGEIEGDRESHLPRRQIVAEEGVGFLGGGEAGILADGPGAKAVHGRPRPAQIGREARQAVEMAELLQIGGRIKRLDGDALGRLPVEARHRLAREFALRPGRPIGEGFPVGVAHHPIASPAESLLGDGASIAAAFPRRLCKAATPPQYLPARA